MPDDQKDKGTDQQQAAEDSASASPDMSKTLPTAPKTKKEIKEAELAAELAVAPFACPNCAARPGTLVPYAGDNPEGLPLAWCPACSRRVVLS